MPNALILRGIRLFLALFWLALGIILSGLCLSVFLVDGRYRPNAGDLLLNLPLLLIALLIVAFGLSMITLGVLLFLRRHHRLCRRLALSQTLVFPLGTVVGCMTFILLGEEEIRAEWNPPARE